MTYNEWFVIVLVLVGLWVLYKINTNMTIKVLRDALRAETESHARTKYFRKRQVMELLKLRAFHKRFTTLIEDTKDRKKDNDKQT